MKKLIFIIFIIAFIFKSNGQIVSALNLSPDTSYENIFSKKLYSDSLTSTFIIWIKNEVVLHKHISHTEQVYILEGTAEMRVGEVVKAIKTGDIIFIPANTAHAVKVTSALPLKVISIQSPEFDGMDRVVIDE